MCDLGSIAHPDAKHNGQLLLSENYPGFEHVDQIQQVGASKEISLILEPISVGLGFTGLPANPLSVFNKPSFIKPHRLVNSISENIYVCIIEIGRFRNE